MMTELLSYFCCPVCGCELRREGKSLLCASGHTFDVAKSGYVNMLPPGKEKNAHTGDEKTMVRARVDFLGRRYYDHISETAAELCADFLGGEDALLCDMGCGEGYHSCQIAAVTAEKRGVPVTMIGFDASKYAAECACKLAIRRGMLPKEGIGTAWEAPVTACFLPGNLFRLPLKEHVIDAAFSLFAPIAGEETRRILKPGGILAVVSSGREHLTELRELIYTDVHKSDVLPPVPAGFSEKLRQRLTYPIHLENRDDLANLFIMTPFYYKTTVEGRERLLSHDSLEVTVDVEISLFEAE